MKRLLLLFVAVFALALAGPAFAGTPLDQAGQNNQGPYSNTSVFGSSAPTTGQAATIVWPVVTKNSGGQSILVRNCVSKIILQLSTASTFYALDGGTTFYTIYGTGLGTSGTNTISLPEDHLGPLCGTAGNSMTFSIPAPSAATVNNVINAEGFTFAGYGNNSGQ